MANLDSWQQSGYGDEFPSAFAEPLESFEDQYPEDRDFQTYMFSRFPAESSHKIKHEFLKLEGGSVGLVTDRARFTVSDWSKRSDRLVDIFFKPSEGKTIRLSQILNNLSLNYVEIYVSHERLRTPYNAQIIDESGNSVDAIFINRPMNLVDILFAFHEVGHSLARDSAGDVYSKIKAGIDDIDALSLTDEDLDKSQHRQLDLGIVKEMDAWSAAINIIREAGLRDMLQLGTDEFANLVMWSILSRVRS